MWGSPENCNEVIIVTYDCEEHWNPWGEVLDCWWTVQEYPGRIGRLPVLTYCHPIPVLSGQPPHKYQLLLSSYPLHMKHGPQWAWYSSSVEADDCRALGNRYPCLSWSLDQNNEPSQLTVLRTRSAVNSAVWRGWRYLCDNFMFSSLQSSDQHILSSQLSPLQLDYRTTLPSRHCIPNSYRLCLPPVPGQETWDSVGGDWGKFSSISHPAHSGQIVLARDKKGPDAGMSCSWIANCTAALWQPDHVLLVFSRDH